MNTLKTLSIAALIATSPLAVVTAAANGGDVPGNVVEVAAEAGTFETLLAAATAAGLAEALATTDGITVFAPTDDAFAALPEGTVESLLMEENLDDLAAILTLHVVPTVVMSGDLAEGDTVVDTLNPDVRLTVTASVDGVTVSAGNTANVIAPDIEASNGVIHVIDAVLTP